jgi:hypothetical protein
MSSLLGPRQLGIAICIGVATLIVFAPLGRYDFVNFDDPLYVTENPHVLTGLEGRNVAWAFSTNHAANWHPLTWLSLMVDAELASEDGRGLSAATFHWTNILLHALNSGLVYVLFARMTKAAWSSLLIAVLFAIHPLHIESVAWIPERKDVLSTFFGLLALDAYAIYCLHARRWWYLVSIGWFLLSLLSKQMLVTLPGVLLLFDYWPLQRCAQADRQGLSFAKRPWLYLLIEKIPYVLLSLAATVTVVLAQESGNAIRSLTKYPLDVRLGNAAVSLVKYLGMTVWPCNLAFFYPFQAPSAVAVIGAVALLVGVTVICWLVRKRYPFAIVGWLFYLGTLLPVIGIVQVGDQALADRYTYVPLLGIFLIVSFSLQAVTQARPNLRGLIVLASATAVGVLAWTTTKQIPVWRNSETLYTHALAVTEKNETAHIQLANHYKENRKYTEAIQQYQQALKLRPQAAEFLANLGSVYLDLGKVETAMTYFRQAQVADPNLAFVLNNLAWVLATSSDAKLYDPAEAVLLAERACTLESPPNIAFVDTLAAAYAAAGRYPDAVRVATEAQSRARQQGLEGLAQDMETRLVLYRAGRPYREPRR